MEVQQGDQVIANFQTHTCPSCKMLTYAVYYYCPNCGKQLRARPLSTSVGRQIGIYLLSIFMPPFGFWPGFKYLMQPNTKAKIIGFIAVALTIASTVITTYYTFGFIDKVNQFIGLSSMGQLSP